MKWTDEQMQVLTARGTHLLVAAAAGSGKTAVLVERIVRLVMDETNPVDLDRILVVTFTQAAASEMKERIRAAITKLANEGHLRARLQLLRVNDAPISTIHSFCGLVLREHFHQAGLEPGFRVGEQTECQLMLSEALERLLDDRYGEVPLAPALADLLDCYSGYRDDSRLREQILSLWRFSRTMPWPDVWLDASVARMRIPEGVDFGHTDWGRILLEEARLRLEDMARETEAASRLAEDTGFAAYAETFQDDAEKLESLTAALEIGWDAAVTALRGAAFTTLRRAPKDADPVVRDKLKQMRQRVRKLLSRLGDEVLTGDSVTLGQEIGAEAGRMEALAELVRALDRTYARGKRRRNVVDFDDLEHLTLDLLITIEAGVPTPTALAASMRERWHSVMIDEYQDSNLVQEAILGAIATQTEAVGNLFMVGDVKQSVYRFRQAMPELFLDKYARYPLMRTVPSKTAVNQAPAFKILLHRNFRSRAPVLEAVNLAFARLMTPQLGEMVYSDEEALLPGAAFPPLDGRAGAPVVFALLDASRADRDKEPTDTPEDAIPEQHASAERDPVTDVSGRYARDAAAETDEEDLEALGGEAESQQWNGREGSEGEILEAEALEGAQEEAVWAAHLVRQLVHGGDGEAPAHITGKDGRLRQVRYADCAVLLRVTSGLSQVFVEEFARQGVPLFSDTGAGYFASVEVGVVLSFLQVLDNPLQDIPLAAVLRSPLFDWGETMLATVRQTAPDGDFLEAIQNHQGVFQDACTHFLQDLDMWRALSRRLPVSELLERMLDETGYALHVSALPQGARRVANLRLLSERAARFETTGYRGLYQFIQYVERLRLAKGDLDGAKTIGEGEDVVRLMSIHKSKGLEFPVVLVCGTGRSFNLRDGNRRILMHHRYGLGPDGVLPESGATWATAAKRAIQAVSMREMLSEEMRILYVAMTRARERLYVCGRLPDPSGKLEAFAEMPSEGPLPAGQLLPLHSHALWLMAAWGPMLRRRAASEEDVVRLELVDRKRLASWRMTEVATPQIPDQESVFAGGKIRMEIPEGQISFFDELDGQHEAAREWRNLEEIRRRMRWKRSFPGLSSLPSKMTVTALKRLWDEQDEAAAKLEEAFRIACTTPEELEALRYNPDEITSSEGTSLGALGDVVLDEKVQSRASVLHGGMSTNKSGDMMRDEKVQPEASAPHEEMPGMANTVPFELPAFRNADLPKDKPQAGFQYGTLMHLVLQHLDPENGQRPNLDSVLAKLVDRGLMTAEEATIPNRRMLHAFLDSDLYARMMRANRIFRETPFTVRMSASDILRDPAVPHTETVVMQGIVDCWFVENGGIILVDYKTDRTLNRVPAYRRQLAWYAEALEKTVGLPVRERILWFLHFGGVV